MEEATGRPFVLKGQCWNILGQNGSNNKRLLGLTAKTERRFDHRGVTGESGAEKKNGEKRGGTQQMTGPVTGPVTGLPVGVGRLSGGSGGASLEMSSSVRESGRSQSARLTPADEQNKSAALHRLTLKAVPV